MDDVKRSQWTEDQVLALPPGQEHDYFDRKSGKLLNDEQNFRSALARHASAFANSGGGHLILGMDDRSSQFDGVEPVRSRGTSTREWIEQVLPPLLSHPLQDLRVHTVMRRDQGSSIPVDREVIVIDLGDSALAPHQVAETGTYYYRVGGHSKPAPHFYLETLRSRLTAPVLEVWLKEVRKLYAVRKHGRPFLALGLVAGVRNIGRVAAYKWDISMDSFAGLAAGREGDYYFDPAKFPFRIGRETAISLDSTILPSRESEHVFPIGLSFRTAAPIGHTSTPQYLPELHDLISEHASVTLRAISETSPGRPITLQLAGAVDFQALAYAVSMAGDAG